MIETLLWDFSTWWKQKCLVSEILPQESAVCTEVFGDRGFTARNWLNLELKHVMSLVVV